jgi:hypothetical protein
MRDTSPGKINSDIPVTVNFDGNFKARDNKSKSILGVNRPSAQVYYHVVESKTHYFITYALYYPSRYDRNSDERNEHDFAGGVAVVERATNELVLFEGVKVDPGGHTAIGFKPATSEVSGTGSSFTPLESFDPADGIEDSTHYRMFVTSGIHETCSWANEGPNITPAICRHEAKEFPGGTMAGVVMRHGEAQKFSDATTNATSGFLNMNYGLVPFASSLWKRRSDVGSERIFEQVAAYEPIGSRADRPEGAERPIVLPGKMVSDDALSFGFSPATWLESTGTNNAGQWLLDPAYMLLERYNFTGDYSTDYCVNLFLGIDRRGDTMHPECT